MSAVETIKAQIAELSPRQRMRLAAWFMDREEQEWDRQIAADFDAGKLDHLIHRAQREARQGCLQDLP